MSVFDHGLIADRILHAIDEDALNVDQRIALATAHATLATAHAKELGNFIAFLEYVGELPPVAKVILLARIRRRLNLLPPETADGENENG